MRAGQAVHWRCPAPRFVLHGPPCRSQVDKYQGEDRTCKGGQGGRKKYIKFILPSRGSQYCPQHRPCPVRTRCRHSISCYYLCTYMFTFPHSTAFTPHFTLSFTLKIFLKGILQSDFYYTLSQNGAMT